MFDRFLNTPLATLSLSVLFLKISNGEIQERTQAVLVVMKIDNQLIFNQRISNLRVM